MIVAMSEKNNELKNEAEPKVDEEPAAAPEESGTNPTGAVRDGAEAEDAEDAGEPAAELARLEAECESLRDQALRARAEFDNYKKRTLRDIERIRKTAAERLLLDLLPVVDNLERALAHTEDASDSFAEGVRMVLHQLCGVLESHGVAPIPAMGELFDPNVHEALSHLPSAEYPSDVVMEEYERGYRLGGYVLRPSKVVVSSGPPEAGAEGTADASVSETEEES